jgi:hypothetical protein
MAFLVTFIEREQLKKKAECLIQAKWVFVRIFNAFPPYKEVD